VRVELKDHKMGPVLHDETFRNAKLLNESQQLLNRITSGVLR
jgi:hypothetical protein